MKQIISALVLIVWVGSVSAQLRTGPWRGAVIRNDAVPVYFNFDISKKNGKPVIAIKNGDEKIVIDEVVVKADSVYFQMPFYESSFKASITPEGVMQGVWEKWTYDSVNTLKFEAIPAIKKRFSAVDGKATVNITGLWQASISTAAGVSRPAVATFKQKGNELTGSFVTATGDFRFLEGIVTGNRLLLSTFDGGLLYFFEATIDADSIVDGRFYIGSTRVDSWVAKKNPAATIDVTEVTPVILSDAPVQFSFRDVNGELVSLSDRRFADKLIVLQIMGSWCPNCMDETKFLSEIYGKYASKGVEIIGLAYELSTDFERSQRSLKRVIERFDVKYPVLITGVGIADEERTKKTLPQMSDIQTFPTTLFLNKNKQIVEIHTGFSGPGTEGFYDQYVKQFKTTLEKLLNVVEN
jgi:thiol-disulfide isomerase/thioredoxin